MDQVLHERAAGPFLMGVGGTSGGSGGRSVLLRPYGPLFALHQDGEHLLTCSPTGPIIYKVCCQDISVEVLSLISLSDRTIKADYNGLEIW